MTDVRAGIGLSVLSWALVATALVLLGAAKAGGIGYDFFHLQDAAVGVMFPLLGVLILSRRGRHPIAWILIVAGLSGALGVFGEEYVTYGYEFRPGSLPAVATVAWLGSWTWFFFFALMPILLFLFPDGRLTSPRWQPLFVAASVPVVAGPMLLAFATWHAPLDVLTDSQGPVLTNPVLEVALAVTIGLFALALASSVGSLGRRWTQTRGVERQQVKVFSVAALGGVSCLVLSQAGIPMSEAWGVAAFLLPPAGVAAAILRYRLYDIDRLVSRTVSYGLVTAVLLGIYFGSVFVLSNVLPFEGEFPTALSTLAVAGLFNPLRRWIQVAVDRRFNRTRYDAEKTVDGFARRLRSGVGVGDLRQHLEEVAVESVEPTHVSLWIAGRIYQ